MWSICDCNITGMNTSENACHPPFTQTQYSHSPAPVDELHGLHRQRRGYDIIGVVPPPAHHDEPVHLTSDEDETARADEAQQAGPYEGVLADQPAARAHGVNLQTRTMKVQLHSRHGNQPGPEIISDITSSLT